MKNPIYTFCIFSLLFSCSTSEEEITYDSLVHDVLLIERDVLQANGSDIVNGLILFKDGANPDNIKAKITLINGTFQESGLNEFIIVPEQNPEVGPRDLWKDEFKIQTTTLASRLSAEVEVNGYTRRYPIQIMPSLPNNITITASNSSAPFNFLGEVSLEGILKNEQGKKVSNGAKVQFRDVLSNGTSANGNFRTLQTTTGAESKVTAVYSPGLIEPNQYVTILVEVIDRNGDLTGISDAVDIWVYPL